MEEQEYEVTFREVLEQKVKYRGKSELEAVEKAKKDYYNEKIILTAEDFSYAEFSAEPIVPIQKRTKTR